MTAENFETLLHTLRKRQPFRAFTIELKGGKQFEVDHQDALIVRYGVGVYIAAGGVPIWFDHDCVSQIIGSINNRAI